MLEDFDVGGDGVCSNCEASFGHGTGAAADVPCQRCGMYLPSHELQMWNSRLYCAYCIMDVKDEEKMMRGGHGHGDEHAQGGDNLQAHYGKKSGTCERCGRNAETLYSSQGRMLCSHCYHEGGGASSSERPTMIGMLASCAASALGLKIKPADERKPDERKGHGERENPGGEKPHGGAGKSGLRTRVFDTKTRKLTDKTEMGEGSVGKKETDGGKNRNEKGNRDGRAENPGEKSGGSGIKKFLFRLRGKFWKGKEK